MADDDGGTGTLSTTSSTSNIHSAASGVDISLVSSSADQITYTWKNLNVWTQGEIEGHKNPTCFGRKGTNAKQILKNVSGLVRPGELLALMGASGAGKSTLLNVLNYQNVSTLKVIGERAINGVPVTPNILKTVSAYIQQQDLFIGTLTVRQHLIFQAQVRMHRGFSYKQRLKRIDEVIQELGLSSCANSTIGTPGRVQGISGGEMKRLAFASEVLTDPPLFFCDEPTSGLDSFMAQTVVQVLKNLSHQGKTVLCTIHQPSSQVFEMFDRIIMLAEGRVAFAGDVTNALDFFKVNGYECPANYNPSDFYIQTLAIQPGIEETCRQSVVVLCDAFDNSQEGKEIGTLLAQHHQQANPESVALLEKELKRKSLYKVPLIPQLSAVFWRAFQANLRDPVFIRMKVVQTLALGLLIGSIYFGQKFDQNGVQNIGGALFMILMTFSFGYVMQTVEVFCHELPVFLRENFNGLYRTDTYFLGKMFAEAPFFIVFPLVGISITYFMIGFRPTPEAFFLTTTIYVIVTNCAVSLGYMVSCFSTTLSMALGIAPAIVVPLAIFGGLFLNSGSVPIYFIWMKYISWFYYANEALTVTQWRYVDSIPCDRPLNVTCVPNGKAVLKNLEFDEENLARDFIGMAALLIAFRLLAYLSLLAKTYRKK